MQIILPTCENYRIISQYRCLIAHIYYNMTTQMASCAVDTCPPAACRPLAKIDDLGWLCDLCLFPMIEVVVGLVTAELLSAAAGATLSAKKGMRARTLSLFGRVVRAGLDWTMRLTILRR